MINMHIKFLKPGRYKLFTRKHLEKSVSKKKENNPNINKEGNVHIK